MILKKGDRVSFSGLRVPGNHAMRGVEGIVTGPWDHTNPNYAVYVDWEKKGFLENGVMLEGYLVKVVELEPDETEAYFV